MMKFSNVNLLSKRRMFTVSSSILLAYSFGIGSTYIANATELNDTEDIHIQTELREDEVLGELGLNSGEELREAFDKFLSNYTSLSEQEIFNEINKFELYLDDTSTIHSMIEGIEADVSAANNNKDLADKITQLKLQNSSEFINNLVTTSSTVSADTVVERVDGQNRFRVAENISKRGWVSSETVLIANGQKFTDALSGMPLASHLNAPMLLVNEKTIDGETLNEIKRLGAKNIIVLGGPHSVSEQVVEILKSHSLSVRRIAGETRYDTSAKIAEEIISLRGPSTAHLVNGEAFADAVSISTVAGRYKQPILLTKSNELTPEVVKITEQVKDWRIIGGAQSISTTVENQLASRVNRASRISGENRYEVNKNVLNNWGINSNKIYLGSGDAFADILTGSVLAAKENTGVLLLNDNEINIQSAEDFSKKKSLDHFVVLGGLNTLSNTVSDSFDQLYRDPSLREHVNGIYTVRKGDTFNAIAKSFNLSAYQLSLWNKHITNKDALNLDDKIAVTRKGVETLLSSTERAKLTSTNNPSQFKSVYDFIDWMGPLAIEVSSEPNQEALYPSLMIAQAIHESGVARTYGESQLARPPYHNLFGIKASGSQDYTLSWTGEYFNGEYVEILAKFRRFPSYKESLQRYAQLLRVGRGTGEDFYYRGTWRSNTKDVWEVLDNGGLRGYATDPAYFTAIRRVITNYNLTTFDNK